MIRGEHVRQEIEQLETVEKKFREEGREFEASVLKQNNLILKLLTAIRQNQVKANPELLKNKNNAEG